MKFCTVLFLLFIWGCNSSNTETSPKSEVIIELEETDGFNIDSTQVVEYGGDNYHAFSYRWGNISKSGFLKTEGARVWRIWSTDQKKPDLWFDLDAEPYDTIWDNYGPMVQFCGSINDIHYFYEEFLSFNDVGKEQLVWAVKGKDAFQVEIGRFSIDSCGRASVNSPTDSSFFDDDALRLFNNRRPKIIADVKGIDRMARLIRPDWILEYGGIGDSVRPQIDIQPYLNSERETWNISTCLYLRGDSIFLDLDGEMIAFLFDEEKTQSWR